MTLGYLPKEREKYAHNVGAILYEADCSLCRHGILFGLQIAFPCAGLTTEDIGFGLSSGPRGPVPVLCDSPQVDHDLAEAMAQWVRGFCAGFLYSRS